MQHDFILLDRSGSMETLWVEALGSVNAYVSKLAEDKVDTGVTIAVFDNQSFDVIRDRIIPSTMLPVTKKDAMPRGGTPLSDSVGKIVDLADKGSYDKVAIIIMTDGQENASSELTVPQAKALLDRCRAKGWSVTFLGANFDNAAQGASYGNASAHTATVAPQNLRASASMMASKRYAYAQEGATAEATMSFSDDEKARLAKGT